MTKVITCYRPQRSCLQGNVFTPVCHSVHRGVCVACTPPCHAHVPCHTCPLPHMPPSAMQAPLPCTPLPCINLPHIPPATHAPCHMHAPLPCMSPCHAHPLPHMPPSAMHAPCHTCPLPNMPRLPHTPPTMHTPHHACPP